MEIQKFQCPYCGGNLKPTENKNIYTCSYCRGDAYVETFQEISQVLKYLDNEKQERIANIRKQLYDAVTAEYISKEEVIKHCQELKNYLQNDFMANFFETVAKGNAKKINEAINGIEEKNFGYADLVLNFMIKSLKRTNELPLKNFVERIRTQLKGGEYSDYMTAIEREIEKIDDDTFNVNSDRDVFVAYSSADMKSVMEIVEMLETEEKLDCFVALRNLRKGVGAVENYEKHLQTAMRHCKCVVFLSSKNSRNLECDALDKELPYIKDNLPNMGRIEYILEEYDYNDLSRGVRKTLKDFFAGKEWCRNFDDLVGRILEYRRKTVAAPTVKIGEPKLAGKFCKACGKESPEIAQVCMFCGNKEFFDTKKRNDYDKLENAFEIQREEIEREKERKAKSVYKREGQYVYFGEYPQTIKAYNVTVSNTADNDGYYSGSDGYRYAKVTATPKDSGYKFSNNATIIIGTVYYFKVEPIRWRILAEKDGKALILCDSIIANHRYDGNRNNYANSEIRAWLNNEFYKKAFNSLQQELIQITNIDNSVASTGFTSNCYACENTDDKVFLLSCKEAKNSAYGFNSSNRQLQTSDYARATGVWMNTDSGNYGKGWWWLRSPFNYYSYHAILVRHGGDVEGVGHVDTVHRGVAVALEIQLL